MGNFLSTYQKTTKYPFGKFIFNKGIGFVSPFFGKLRPLRILAAEIGATQLKSHSPL